MTIVCRWPLHGHWPHVHSVHTHIRPHFLPMPRGTAQSVKDTDWGRRNLPALENTMEMEWVDPGPSCSWAHLRNESASALSILHTIPRGHGETAARPLALLHWLFLQRGDRHTGLPKAPSPKPQPQPQHSTSSAGACCGKLSPSWFLPSGPSLARTGMMGPMGDERSLEHTGWAYWHGKYCTATKARE